jgi:transcriptional antiterminator RfaH
MDQWYTLHTKPNAEYQVATTLQQRGLQIYLPELKTAKPNKEWIKKPFFPCYLFIKVDFQIVGFSSVQWTPGLRRVVAFDHQPVPLPDEVIQLIRRRLGEIEAGGGLPLHSFEPGDTVRITAGPFRDMMAIFDRPTSSRERVQVLLHILGQASRVQVAATDLEKASGQVDLPPPVTKRPRRTRGRGRRINNASWQAG